MVDAGDTISFWVGEGDVKLIEEWDEYYKQKSEGPYSRGEWIREAMQLQLAIDRALDEVDMELDDPRQKRMYVRQAIFNDARE